MQTMSVNKNVNETESQIHASSASETEATQPYNSSSDPESANEQDMDQEMESSYSAPAALPAKKSHSGVALCVKVGIVALIGAIAIAVCLIVFFVCFNKNHDDEQASGSQQPGAASTTAAPTGTGGTTAAPTDVTTPSPTHHPDDEYCAFEEGVNTKNKENLCAAKTTDKKSCILDGDKCISNQCTPIEKKDCGKTTVRMFDSKCVWDAEKGEKGLCVVNPCTQIHSASKCTSLPSFTDATTTKGATTAFTATTSAFQCEWIKPSGGICSTNLTQENCKVLGGKECAWEEDEATQEMKCQTTQKGSCRDKSDTATTTPVDHDACAALSDTNDWNRFWGALSCLNGMSPAQIALTLWTRAMPIAAFFAVALLINSFWRNDKRGEAWIGRKAAMVSRVGLDVATLGGWRLLDFAFRSAKQAHNRGIYDRQTNDLNAEARTAYKQYRDFVRSLQSDGVAVSSHDVTVVLDNIPVGSENARIAALHDEFEGTKVLRTILQKAGVDMNQEPYSKVNDFEKSDKHVDTGYGAPVRKDGDGGGEVFATVVAEIQTSIGGDGTGNTTNDAVWRALGALSQNATSKRGGATASLVLHKELSTKLIAEKGLDAAEKNLLSEAYEAERTAVLDWQRSILTSSEMRELKLGAAHKVWREEMGVHTHRMFHGEPYNTATADIKAELSRGQIDLTGTPKSADLLNGNNQDDIFDAYLASEHGAELLRKAGGNADDLKREMRASLDPHVNANKRVEELRTSAHYFRDATIHQTDMAASFKFA